MSAVMMPGAPVADAVFAELRPRIDALVDRGFTPGLGTILVGSDSASEGYTGNSSHIANITRCRTRRGLSPSGDHARFPGVTYSATPPLCRRSPGWVPRQRA